MKFITNLKSNNDLITFHLNNISKEIKISYANAIRRIIISDLYTYTIDNNSIEFYTNNSMLNNDFLRKRLELIPIISDLNNINYDDIIISCKKDNEQDDIINIYINDFVCKDKNDNIIENKIIFKQLNILFSKLNKNQSIAFECKLKKSNAYYSGSSFSPVSVCYYTFKIDNKKVKEITNEMDEKQKKVFLCQDVERIYEKNDLGEPHTYEFYIESIGFYNINDIFKLGINSLKEKLNSLMSEFLNDKSKKITILDNDDENNEFTRFLIDHENDTIGNLLSSYVSFHKDIFYCGYLIEHPLKNNIIFKIKLKKDNNINNIINVINSVINDLIKLSDNILNEYLKNI